MNLKLRYKLGTVVALLASIFLWGRCSKKLPATPGPLPKDTLVRITVNPDKHHLRIESKFRKPIDTFLPDRPSTFEVKDNGTIKISVKQWGFERHFFCGATMSDAFRLTGGMDFFYWKKLDVGIGVAGKIGNYTPVVFGKVSYVIYNNLQIGITYDNMQHIGGALTLRV